MVFIFWIIFTYKSFHFIHIQKTQQMIKDYINNHADEYIPAYVEAKKSRAAKPKKPSIRAQLDAAKKEQSKQSPPREKTKELEV